MVEKKLFVTSQKTINFLSISNNDLHVYTIHHFIDILEIFVSILWYILYEINVSFLMGYFIYFFHAFSFRYIIFFIAFLLYFFLTFGSVICIRSSHKFVPFFERLLYMLRLFTYLSVS